MRPSLRLLLPLALALAAFASACGGSESESPTAQSGSPAAGATATPRLSGTPALTGQPVPNSQGAVWCPVGIYSQTQSGQGVIEGLVQFKGGTYCKIVATSSSVGVSVSYTYYYNENSSDTWSVLDVNGMVTETHFLNGSLVSQVQSTVEPSAGSTPRATQEPFTGTGWCVAGTDMLPGGGLIFGHFEGIVEFKGDSYCKAVRSQTVNGQTVISTYYFKQDVSDVWLVTEFNGNVTETHVVGG